MCDISGKLANSYPDTSYKVLRCNSMRKLHRVGPKLTTSCSPSPLGGDNSAGSSPRSLETDAVSLPPPLPFPSPPPPLEPPATAAEAMSEGRLSVQNSMPVHTLDCSASTMRGTPSFSRSPPPVCACQQQQRVPARSSHRTRLARPQPRVWVPRC